MLLSRRSSIVALLLAAAGLLSQACESPAVAPLSLPGGLDLGALTGAPREHLRMTLEIDNGVLDETDVVVDVDEGTISGDIGLNNAGGAGTRLAILRAYSRANADAVEVLIADARTDVEIQESGDTFLSFDDATFVTCAPAPGAACALRYDSNRNGRSNFEDLTSNPIIDPAPQAPFVSLAPSTLQFASGIRLGNFARQIVVLENTGDNPIVVRSIAIAGGQGVGASLFDPDLGVAGTPRRQISAEELAGVSIAPGAELFVAVSFAPVNAFVASANLQIVAEDTVTGVQQGQRTKILANVDGTLRPVSDDYVVPTLPETVGLGSGSVPLLAYPPSALFSGQSVLSFDSAAAPGIPKAGAVLQVGDVAMPADAAFYVKVGQGERFATSVAGLSSDIDLAVLEVDENFAPREVLATSRNAGTSAEAVEVLNADGEKTLLVVLGRLDEEDEPSSTQGGLSASERAPVEIICTSTRGPEFDDAAPVSPDRGPIEGGIAVTVRGRGVQPGAVVTFAEIPAGDVDVSIADDGLATISLTLPPGSLEIGKNPATIVVQNPSIEDGGDGQAATLPAGFTYNPPRPGLVSITPDFATTTGGGAPVELSGFFFSNRFGAPRVNFDAPGADNDISVEATFVSADTLFVIPPAHAAGNVNVTVQNAIDDDTYGTPSEPRAFQFIQPAGNPPTLATVAPTTGIAEGGETVTLTGTEFRVGARVFFGTAEGTVLTNTTTTLTVRTPVQTRDGVVDVKVVNADGQTATLTGGFTLAFSPPTITVVTPAVGTDAGGTPVIVAGTGFRTGVTASFTPAGGQPIAALATSRLSATSLLITTPAVAAGDATLTVRNTDGRTATTPFAFVTPSGPAPSISFLDPASGSVSGGNPVSIFGTGFQAASRVFFADDELPAETVEFVAGDEGRLDELRITAPSASSGVGTVAVRLVNDDGQSASAAYTFVQDLNPRVSFTSPDRVHTVGNDTINIFGENLLALGTTPTASVIINGTAQAATVRGVSATLIAVQLRTVSLPAGTTSASMTIRLTGQGRTVTTQAITAVAPVPVEVGVGNNVVEIFGNDLQGARLQNVQLTVGTQTVSCTPTIRADFYVRCTPSAGLTISAGDVARVQLTYANVFGAATTQTTNNVGVVANGGGGGVIVEPECRADADCAGQAICNNGVCETPVPCEVDENCADNQVCDAGICRAAGDTGCEVDGDCGRGQVCDSGTCAPAECQVTADCGPDETCFGGRCLAVAPGCGNNIIEDGETCDGSGHIACDASCQELFEPNDTVGNAGDPLEGPPTAAIAPAGDIDFFTLEGVEPGVVLFIDHVDGTPCTGAEVVQVQDLQGQIISTPAASPGCAAASVTAPASPAFISIRSLDNAVFTYLLDAIDPGNGGELFINNGNEVVWPAGFDIAGSGFSVAANVRAINQDTFAERSLSAEIVNDGVALVGTSAALAPGFWQVCVDAQCGFVSIISSGGELEPNDSLASPQGLFFGEQIAGINNDGSSDFYFVQANAQTVEAFLRVNDKDCSNVVLSVSEVLNGSPLGESNAILGTPGCGDMRITFAHPNFGADVVIGVEGVRSGVSYQAGILGALVGQPEFDDDFDGVFTPFDVDDADPCSPEPDGFACKLFGDLDDDGFPNNQDPQPLNPCAPSAGSPACLQAGVDSDGDGLPDAFDPDPNVDDVDGDGTLDGDEFQVVGDDIDGDGTPDDGEFDLPSRFDPCSPNVFTSACLAIQDHDFDGLVNANDPFPGNECAPFNRLDCGTVDLDGDGYLDGRDPDPNTFDTDNDTLPDGDDPDPFFEDTDLDLTPDADDPDPYDPCAPSTDNSECARYLAGPPVGEPICGNGVIESGEQCDDGDVALFDGCDDFCQEEPGFACTGVDFSICRPVTCFFEDLFIGSGDALVSTGGGVAFPTGEGMSFLAGGGLTTIDPLVGTVRISVDVAFTTTPASAIVGTRSNGEIDNITFEPSGSAYVRLFTEAPNPASPTIVVPDGGRTTVAAPFALGSPTFHRVTWTDDGFAGVLRIENGDTGEFFQTSFVSDAQGIGQGLVLSGDGQVRMANLEVCQEIP